MIDYIVLTLFTAFMIFIVRGFTVQMQRKNEMREKIKQMKEAKNDERITD
jgi:hypothetical protein